MTDKITFFNTKYTDKMINKWKETKSESAKKPTFYLELHNFSFQRNDYQKQARGFIGRKNVRARLRSILNHSEQRSGTYLITGNRGVGKTSLVNKVLNELAGEEYIKPNIRYFIYVLICTLASTAVIKLYDGYTQYVAVTSISLLIALIFSIVYFVHFSFYRKQGKTFAKDCGLIILQELFLWNQYQTSHSGKVQFRVRVLACTFIIQLLTILLSGIHISLNASFFWRIKIAILTLTISCFFFIILSKWVYKKLNNRVIIALNLLLVFITFLLIFPTYSICVSAPLLALCYGLLTAIAYMASRVYTLLLRSGNLTSEKLRKNKIESEKGDINNTHCYSKNDKLIKYYKNASLLVTVFLATGIILLTSNYVYTWRCYYYLDEEVLLKIFLLLTLWLYIIVMIVLSCMEILPYMNSLDSVRGLFLRGVKIIFMQLASSHNWINRPKQIFVKINLGYEEMKSLDVLRLLAHNITIEYKKYVYSKRFYLVRSLVVASIGIGITAFFARYVNYNLYDELVRLNVIPSIIDNCIDFIYRNLNLAFGFIWFFIKVLFQEVGTGFDYINKVKVSESLIDINEFFFFLILLAVYKSVSYIPVLRKYIRTPYSDIRSLKELQDSIQASIKSEKGIKVGGSLWSISNITQKNVQIMDAHDIEKRLIDIMNSLCDGWLFQKPQFIIIFDELDKIESEESKKEKLSKTDSFSPDIVRMKQDTIFELLAGLKYILSTMPAKFIFVAGREMYEASLADASDRSHYLSSIFDDVINVPSFMSDFSDDKSYDLCSMTEQYLCRFLIPGRRIVPEYTLQEYGKYLAENNANDTDLSNEDAEILVHLKNFITYLTYVGKGAPKKMIGLLEKHVVKLQPYAVEDLRRQAEYGYTIPPVIRKFYANTTFFLKLDFFEQYTIGLTARMISPVIYRFSHLNIHQYGDKLLVSTLFFMDHLYKFHNHSFSWRALACTPELIDVHKTPDLRNHIKNILHYLSQNDLKVISNGLYDFRFFKAIAQEINFMTKVSESASAVYNFSLDESFAIKQFYERRLRSLRSTYDADHIADANRIYELADLHFTLGELNLYDDELGYALMEFDAAISVLQTLSPDKLTQESIFALIKNMLSLGIAYERQNLNDEAFLVYSRVVELIIASRNTNIDSLGLQTYADGADMDRMKVTPKSNVDSGKEPEVYFRKSSPSNLMSLLDSIPHLHPQIHAVISKINGYESLQIFYLPLLAKLQILEKSQLGGIQLRDISRIMKEFYFLVNMVNKENKNLICSSFYLKLGNILYFKNSRLLGNETFCNRSIWPFPVNRTCSKKDCLYRTFCHDCSSTHQAESNECRNCLWQLDSQHDALMFYVHSLFLVIKGIDYELCYNMNQIIEMLYKLKNNDLYRGWDDVRFNMLGKILSCIGDVILSDINMNEKKSLINGHNIKHKIQLSFFIYSYIKQKASGNLSTIDILKKMLNQNHTNYNGNKLVKACICYLLSAMYFQKSTSYNMSAYVYTKILQLLKDNSEPFSHKERSFKEIFLWVIDNTGKAFKDISLADQQALQNVAQSNSASLASFGQNTFLCGEVYEAQLAYYSIELNALNTVYSFEEYLEKVKILYEKCFGLIHYKVENNMYNRISMLKFKTDMNYRWLKAICKLNNLVNDCKLYYKESYSQTGIRSFCEVFVKGIENVSLNNINQDTKDRISFLIRDSIFNLTEILKIVPIYGETFLLTNLFVADTYGKLSHWLTILNTLKKHHFWTPQDDQLLSMLVGERYVRELEAEKAVSNAMRFYFKAEESHREGRTYKDMLNRACFLNDDFSDLRLHFITAQERKQVLSCDFKSEIRKKSDSDVLKKNYRDMFGLDNRSV